MILILAIIIIEVILLSGFVVFVKRSGDRYLHDQEERWNTILQLIKDKYK